MKSKSIKDRIRDYFFMHPSEKLRVRQIERAVKVPLHSAIRYAGELEDESLLKSAVMFGVKVYSADRGSKKFLIEKKIFNMGQIYDSGLIDFLAEKLGNPGIVIFGSYSKGEDVESSDIDIYVEGSSKKEIALGKFENILKRKIQIFRHKNLREIKNRELANNMINGIILNGFIKVFG